MIAAPQADLVRENERLRLENGVLKEERDILKKHVLSYAEGASVETFFKPLKAEMIWRQKWQSRRQAEAAIFQHINGFYNTRRRHSYLGSISPLAFKAKVA